jgi:hypothetical protein
MHFTYQSPEKDLQQGDILKRTPELMAVLKEAHPYYHSNPDYKYLIVLTQSCDLVQRDGQRCKSRYITLAAVRSLTTLVQRELAKYQRSDREKKASYCRLGAKNYIIQFFERLLNNNELGYFYLHDDLALGIQEPVVAFLSLSIAIKADIHYKTCIDARIAQLQENFQAKLGWLVGQMYSRVGTPDWVDSTCTNEEFERMIKEKVDNLGILWVKDQYIPKLANAEKTRKKTEADYELTIDDVRKSVEEYTREEEEKKKRIVTRAVEIIATICPDIDQKTTRLCLENDSELSRLINLVR